jgi:hypothetical protein
MVKSMDTQYQYAIADDTELDTLLSGQKISSGVAWNQWSKSSRPRAGTVGVVWQEKDADRTVRPLALVVNEDDIQRLCGRYAQLHNDLSPLTAWCHLLTPRFMEPLDSLVRNPELGGLEAAWTGLIVAEAILLAEIPLSRIRISACLATYSFAIARGHGLWGHIATDDVTRRFDTANRLLKSEGHAQRAENRTGKIRTSLQPIWESLIAISSGRASYLSSESEPIVSALRGLSRARSDKDVREVDQLIRPLLHYVPEAELLEQLNDLPPESRLRVFDKLVEALEKTEIGRDKLRRNALAMLAGYLATVAAGGSPSLTLAEGLASRWPEITAWAYLTGGLGEKIVWTSSFDGLGRLVARELTRPMRLDEPPTCDFAFDEAAVLIDPKLSDPLVHLRIKQARLVTVELLPGVNVSIPISEGSSQSITRPDTNRPTNVPEFSPRDPLGSLVDALWPHFKARLDNYLATSERNSYSPQNEESNQRNKGKRKSGGQTQLPLNNPKRF